MATLKDWLNQKFAEWEKAAGRRQSYYAFAQHLEVSQSALGQWMVGSAVPSGEDLITIANKLGLEAYDILGLPRPNAETQRITVSFASLPLDIRQRLTNAIAEADQTMRQQRQRPDTAEGRKIAIESLAKWGFRFTG